MLREAVGDFATQQIRPAALAADDACAAPKSCSTRPTSSA